MPDNITRIDLLIVNALIDPLPIHTETGSQLSNGSLAIRFQNFACMREMFLMTVFD